MDALLSSLVAKVPTVQNIDIVGRLHRAKFLAVNKPASNPFCLSWTRRFERSCQVEIGLSVWFSEERARGIRTAVIGRDEWNSYQVVNAIRETPTDGIARLSGQVAGCDILIEVEDSGPRIQEEGMARIFDPMFFTSREGCGSELPMVNGIVESHNGTIAISA
jgi:hypothetical protein